MTAITGQKEKYFFPAQKWVGCTSSPCLPRFATPTVVFSKLNSHINAEKLTWNRAENRSVFLKSQCQLTSNMQTHQNSHEVLGEGESQQSSKFWIFYEAELNRSLRHSNVIWFSIWVWEVGHWSIWIWLWVLYRKSCVRAKQEKNYPIRTVASVSSAGRRGDMIYERSFRGSEPANDQAVEYGALF